MRGCRPLTEAEIAQVAMCLHRPRDLMFFKLALYTGFRSGEALQLKVKDVWQGGRAVDRITVYKRHTKGQRKSRSIAMSPALKAALEVYLLSTGLGADPESFLFRSREGGNRPVSQTQMWRALKDAVNSLGFGGKIGLHSTRKVFADRMFAHFKGNIFLTSKALGHASIDSTTSYLSFKTAEVDAAVGSLVYVGWPK